jgi:sortase A
MPMFWWSMKTLRCRLPLLAMLTVVLVVGSITVALTPGRAQGSSSRPLLTNLIEKLPERVSERVGLPERAPLAVRAVEPALAIAASTPPTPPPPPNPVPPLPNPAPLPNAGNRVALVDVGRIQIPKIGLDQTVHEGVEQMVIDAGPAHWPGTAAFGSWGNVVLAGHRTTHTEPFLRAAELAPGDEIVLSDPSGTYTYHVTGTQVVENTALWIVNQAPGRTLTIFTCHPIGSSAQRLIVRAQLMSTPRPGQ